MKLEFKYDSGHGWGKVLLSELLKYNLIEKISKYSYVDDKLKYAYLEEDCDLGLYIDELKKDISKKISENGYNVDKINIDANLQQESENPGIHNIDLVITNNKIESVKKVDIRKQKENEAQQNSENIEKIKEELAKYYEVDKKIINIKLK